MQSRKLLLIPTVSQTFSNYIYRKNMRPWVVPRLRNFRYVRYVRMVQYMFQFQRVQQNSTILGPCFVGFVGCF